jgi:hypothetical protein
MNWTKSKIFKAAISALFVAWQNFELIFIGSKYLSGNSHHRKLPDNNNF